MSSDPLQNLSSSINLRDSNVLSVDVTRAVNRTLNKFYSEAHYQDYLSLYEPHKNLFVAEKNSAMQSEKIIMCEINAGLWAKAIKSAISSSTQQTYPHYIIVQEFINYLLNTETEENFGLLENFFWQLLLFHPPSPEMFDYYYQIMFNHFITLNNQTTEEQNLFACLMDGCINSLQNMVNSTGYNECNPDFIIDEKDDSCTESSDQERIVAKKNLNILEKDSPTKKATPQKVYFQDLHWKMRIKRCLIALNFVYNVLEMDFVFWLHSKKWKPFVASRESRKETRLLLSHILWPNARDVGLINKNVHRVLDLYKSLIKSNLRYQYKSLIEKYAILIGEVIRCSDSVEGMKYPFVGTKSENFFRELSIILHEVIKICQTKKFPKDKLIVNFKPPWLRLFLCSHLLSSITGSQCPPELTTAYDILIHIIHNENRSKDTVEAPSPSRQTRVLRPRQKLKNLKSINAKLASGKTHLHVACEENDVEKIKAILAFPELDVNITDREGWTALHRAAYEGNLASVKELLLFSPQWGDLQKSVNTRARGPQSITPIMCAALKSHADVCRILLEHSGSILLEDTNEFNQSALELSNSPEVSNILEYYKKNNVSTFHSHKNICFDSDMKHLVLRLCVEMIQAYFCTHRTWDVYRALKRFNNSSGDDDLPAPDMEIQWDYMRYHRDIKRNICKLRTLVPKLEKVEEFKDLQEVYTRVLSFNKAC